MHQSDTAVSGSSFPQVTMRLDPVVAALAITVVGALAFILLGVHGPDLAAQVARARVGGGRSALWWPGWLGGLDGPTYSVLSGTTMHFLGVTACGAGAALLVAAAGGVLASRSPHPLTVSAFAGGAAVANLFSGRVTFALGMAAAMWSLVSLRRGSRWTGRGLGALAGLLSPLAALTLVTVLAGILSRSSDPWRRPAAVAAAVLAAGVPVGLVTVALSSPSVMPFGGVDLAAALGTVALVWRAHRGRLVARVALVAGGVVLVAAVWPSALGENSTRALMLAAPALLAASPRRDYFTAVLVLSLLWPTYNLAADLIQDAGPSSRAAYYQPLAEHLPESSTTSRIEVLDPATHGATEWLSGSRTLARGWERQIDIGQNPMFYGGRLTAKIYRHWLDDLAVSYVAVPHAPLDYGYTSEAALITGGLPYLQPTWHNTDWSLYAVRAPTPLIAGPAHVTRVGAGGIDLDATASGQVLIRVRWSPLLRLVTLNGKATGAAPRPAGTGLLVQVPRPGSYRLQAGLF